MRGGRTATERSWLGDHKSSVKPNMSFSEARHAIQERKIGVRDLPPALMKNEKEILLVLLSC